MAQFSNKSVLITGASGGLGQQLALDFASKGASVAINYSASEDVAKATAAKINATNGDAIICRANIASPDDVNAMVDQVVAKFGGIDILINNAGLSIDAPFLEMTENAWDQVIDVNLKGPFLGRCCMELALPTICPYP